MKKNFIFFILLTSAFAQELRLNERFTFPTFPPFLWARYNQDGAARFWQRSLKNMRSFPACASIRSEGKFVRNDDWLITRRVFPTPGDNTLSFWCRSHNSNSRESLEVWVSTTGYQPMNFTQRIGAFGIQTTAYQEFTYSLAAFNNRPIYIGFRYVTLSKKTLYLDDVFGPAYLPKDVGVARVLSPRRYENSGTSVIPRGLVRNYGTQNQNNFPVSCIIRDTVTKSTIYSGSATVGSLAPNESITVSFTPSWVPQLGVYQVIMKTLLADDMENRNDSALGLTTVVSGDVQDVGVTEILAPVGMIPKGFIIPVVRVENFGTVSATFPVTFQISQAGTPLYNDTVVVTLLANNSTLVSFEPWDATEGSYRAYSRTTLIGDIDTTNDSQTTDFDVDPTPVNRDIGVTKILQPVGEIYAGTVVTPQAIIENFGDIITTFWAFFSIGGVYRDSQLVFLLGSEPLASCTLSFSNWTALEGEYIVKCSTWTPGDINPDNDFLIDSVRVIQLIDVGVVQISAPSGTIDSGSVITPRATITNYGTNLVSTPVIFRIGTNYQELRYKSLAPGATDTVNFPSWTAQTIGTVQVKCSTAMPGDQNSANDFLNRSVVVVPPPAQGVWIQKRNVPETNKRVKQGGALVYVPPDYVFAFKGNNSNEFYAYNISGDSWVRKKDIPFAEKRKKVKRGSALAYGKDTIFALKGGNTLEFWSYAIGQDTWLRNPDVPRGSKNKRLKAGSGLVYVPTGESSFVYCLKGSNTTDFFAYYIEGKVWLERKSAPLGWSRKPFRAGSCITYSQGMIFALKGGYNEFFVYEIGTDTWVQKRTLPFYSSSNKKKKAKDGASLAADNKGLIYAFKGGNTDEFWCYNITQDSWFEKERIPLTPNNKRVRAGGSLTYAGPGVYALKGNNTLEFWLYLPGTAGYFTQNRDKPTMAENGPRITDIENRIYPNPVKNFGKVRLPLSAKEIKIYNSSGILVKSFVPKSEYIRVSGLPEGVYILKVLTQTQVSGIYKLIIIK